MSSTRAPSRYAVALLVLAAQLLGFAHLALVLHVVCPVHGELIDARGGAPAAVHAAPVDQLASRLQSAGGERLTTDEEDRCVVAAFLRTSLVLRSGPALPAPSLASQPAVADTSDDRAPGRRRLLLAAPKASPPA